MKISKRAKEDFFWYLSVKKNFCFAGKLPDVEIEYSPKGYSALEAYYLYDTYGKKMIICKHPLLLSTILSTKASVNLHIKMYAEDRAKGILPKILFEEIIEEFNCPSWFREAVEQQAKKY